MFKLDYKRQLCGQKIKEREAGMGEGMHG